MRCGLRTSLGGWERKVYSPESPVNHGSAGDTLHVAQNWLFPFPLIPQEPDHLLLETSQCAHRHREWPACLFRWGKCRNFTHMRCFRGTGRTSHPTGLCFHHSDAECSCQRSAADGPGPSVRRETEDAGLLVERVEHVFHGSWLFPAPLALQSPLLFAKYLTSC